MPHNFTPKSEDLISKPNLNLQKIKDKNNYSTPLPEF
jgi:hypothetical protein